MPGLIWNTMMSMSGGWFFVVASEAITVGDTTDHPAGRRLLHRQGQRTRDDWDAIFAAVVTMAIVILLYDQLLFRPIVAWAGKFRVELSVGQQVERSWVLELAAAHQLDPPRRCGRSSTRCARSACGDRLARILPSRTARRRRAARPRGSSTSLWILVILAVAVVGAVAQRRRLRRARNSSWHDVWQRVRR